MSDDTKKYAYGVTKELVEQISRSKKEPEWMLKKRLEAFSLWEQTPLPDWGPDLSGLDLDTMLYYVDPEIEEKDKWADLPEDIVETFDKRPLRILFGSPATTVDRL